VRIALLTLGVLAALTIAVPAAPVAPATASAPTIAPASPSLVPPLAQRRRGGFRNRRRAPQTPAQRRAQQRAAQQRNRTLRRAGRTVLRVLGIAFLLHLLFGIGAGGSAWGLLVLAGLIALFVLARRRRRDRGLAYRY
jgi:hypothetical protein